MRGIYEDGDYWPEFGTLTVRDTWVGDVGDGPFEQHTSRVQPCGTIVRTGYGWLEAAAGDGPVVVRLESHDGAPPEETAGWEDVVEIPYRSRSGVVGLTWVTGGPGEEHLRLAGPGLYRVRVCAGPSADEGMEAVWRLCFWPVAEVEPPRWSARALPAVPAGDGGWRYLFGYHVTDLLAAVWAARDADGVTTVEAVRRWSERQHRGAGWLDGPLPGPGHRELDPADVAAQLGVPAPTSPRDLLAVFAAAGLLVADGDAYRWPEVEPRAQDVLDLSPERRAELVLWQESDRFRSLAADLVSVALWGGARQTVAALAARTLVAEDDVRDTLDWAVRQGLLTVEGPLSGEFTMTVPAAG
ncbi:DUF6042 family protein [Saccharothrix syringae]|uniref:Uncharacterized protein n=1 Tax=Saccharothrix syringae TaxID=103733 RepID=A0A5Q0H3T3_SACSY|nr:DUF6042 family protein [Saccharothrix syringae]QFZ20382.1 hypothetical protein EKG83_25830 [Saccharothrix syringae]